jgi:hypothetical protein
MEIHFVNGLIFMGNSNYLVHAMLSLIVTTPASMTQQEECFYVRQANVCFRFTLFGRWEELELCDEFLLVLTFLYKELYTVTP